MPGLKDGAQSKVIDGKHAGKSGTVTDIKTSKTGHVTITWWKGMGRDLRRWLRMLEFYSRHTFS